MGQAVNLAVGRFVKVGEAIANENWDLKEEINIACIEAKQAGMCLSTFGLFARLLFCFVCFRKQSPCWPGTFFEA